MPKSDAEKMIAQNKKARHDYFVEETYEAGMALRGTEVKSMRLGRVNLKESYALVQGGEVFVHAMHISAYEQGNQFNTDPLRPKKLLLHASEIRKLGELVKRQGYALIPLQVYLKGGRMKLLLGLCKGKKFYDKRDDMAEKDAQRHMQRALREQTRGAQ
ncbi:MAG: SsrA-binding protein SmpB [Oscillospiraceae bacterium]|jgi:SsrA-binding protein|nr:SsrA-binding protein SmpB [Oscillospiraceae bacterium]